LIVVKMILVAHICSLWTLGQTHKITPTLYTDSPILEPVKKSYVASAF
jgi:hypothetical protein